MFRYFRRVEMHIKYTTITRNIHTGMNQQEDIYCVGKANVSHANRRFMCGKCSHSFD